MGFDCDRPILGAMRTHIGCLRCMLSVCLCLSLPTAYPQLIRVLTALPDSADALSLTNPGSAVLGAVL